MPAGRVARVVVGPIQRRARWNLTRLGSSRPVAQQQRWHVAEIHTEEGRLDEVFRSITLPDTVKTAA